jgi:hypothetical protein
LWHDVSCLVERQLFAQKEVFCGDHRRRMQAEPKAPRGIEDHDAEQTHTLPEMTDHAREISHGRGAPARRRISSTPILIVQEASVQCSWIPKRLAGIDGGRSSVSSACGTWEDPIFAHHSYWLPQELQARKEKIRSNAVEFVGNATALSKDLWSTR